MGFVAFPVIAIEYETDAPLYSCANPGEAKLIRNIQETYELSDVVLVVFNFGISRSQ